MKLNYIEIMKPFSIYIYILVYLFALGCSNEISPLNNKLNEQELKNKMTEHLPWLNDPIEYERLLSKYNNIIEHNKKSLAQLKHINKTLIDLLDYFPKETMGYKSINTYINISNQSYKEKINQNEKMIIGQQKFIDLYQSINGLISDKNQKINENVQ